MANSRGKARKMKAGDWRVPHTRRGYEQARLGIAPTVADTLMPDQLAAQTYWNGRLLAANIRAAGLVPPAWSSDNMLPPKVRAAQLAARARVGVYGCNKETHMEIDPDLAFSY
jgi:hypothetical protein